MTENDFRINTKPNLGKRILAGLIDYGLLFAYMAIIIHFFGEPDGEGGYSTSGLPALFIVLAWFLLMIFTEQYLGATLGNNLLKLKPVPKHDIKKPLTFEQSLKRHTLDMFDLWPFGLLGILLIKNTQYNQRLGNLWAKTIVIDTEDLEQGKKM